jgi:hypothetical protein
MNHKPPDTGPQGLAYSKASVAALAEGGHNFVFVEVIPIPFPWLSLVRWQSSHHSQTSPTLGSGLGTAVPQALLPTSCSALLGLLFPHSAQDLGWNSVSSPSWLCGVPHLPAP